VHVAWAPVGCRPPGAGPEGGQGKPSRAASCSLLPRPPFLLQGCAAPGGALFLHRRLQGRHFVLRETCLHVGRAEWAVTCMGVSAGDLWPVRLFSRPPPRHGKRAESQSPPQASVTGRWPHRDSSPGQSGSRNFRFRVKAPSQAQLSGEEVLRRPEASRPHPGASEGRGREGGRGTDL